MAETFHSHQSPPHGNDKENGQCRPGKLDWNQIVLLGQVRLQIFRGWVCSFVVAAYAHTDCNFPEAKDRFYRDLPGLPRSVRSISVVVTGLLSGEWTADWRPVFCPS